MNTTIIDARGEVCPKPLVMTRAAINDQSLKEVFTVLIDNEISKDNVERFLKDNGVFFSTVKEGDYYSISVSKEGSAPIQTPAEDYCQVSEKNIRKGYLVCLNSNLMGRGSDEMGRNLIASFLNTMIEVRPLPESIIFYNCGVELALDDSHVIEPLRQLEKLGCQLLLCGACVDFLKINDRVSIGTISNMLEISEKIANASSVVYP